MITLARRIANRSKDYLLFNPLLEPFWVNKMRGRVAAMLYHQVQGGSETAFLTRGGSPNISAAELGSDLAFFKAQGAKELSSDQGLSLPGVGCKYFPGVRT